jgi:riboflavin synthase
MFTGIIQTLGQVSTLHPKGQGMTIQFKASPDILSALKIGDSIAVNGVCSTAIQIDPHYFTADYLPETLDKSTLGTLAVSDPVNLELCLTLQTPIGGHVVTGHVDTTALITQLDQDDPWGVIGISFDKKWSQNVVPKGSITIDGISLTIATLHDHDPTACTLTCHLIPHTWHSTVLSHKKTGDRVNIEFDMLGKYILRSKVV